MTEKSHRTGYFNARDGRGWQPCVSVLSVEAGLARDAAAKEAQRLHREARAAELRAAGVESRGGQQYVTGAATVPSKLEGLPPVRCRIPVGAVPAPPEAAAAVTVMLTGFVLPAIREETGAR